MLSLVLRTEVREKDETAPFTRFLRNSREPGYSTRDRSEMGEKGAPSLLPPADHTAVKY